MATYQVGSLIGKCTFQISQSQNILLTFFFLLSDPWIQEAGIPQILRKERSYRCIDKRYAKLIFTRMRFFPIKTTYFQNIWFICYLVLVGLYEEPERPPNAVDYIKRYMGAPTGVDVEALRTENEQLKLDKIQLESTIKDLNSKVYLQYCTILYYTIQYTKRLHFNLFAYNSSFRVALNRNLYGLYATFNT